MFYEKDECEGVTLSDSDGNQITIRQVKDSFDTTHAIKKVLGQGGQGLVCLTENPEIVVKFALNHKGQLISRDKDKDAFEKNDAEFKSVVYKPFPDRIHLAYPMARLVDYSGYVMRLMGDMTSFSDLVPSSEEDIKHMTKDGGHRRRFELLAKLAALLTKLHGNGMVYCDLSPNNVFVTKDPNYETQNVWLIDADNVFMLGEDSDKLVYTPRYAAPELLTYKPCSQNSDIYSFATLAFEALAALHPFVGEKATNWSDDGDGWDVSTNGANQANPSIDPQYSGKYPWVEDIEDDSNHTNAGLPRQNFLTDETFALFNMTFSEEGRESPRKRPTASLWTRAFAHSHAMSICCHDHDCGMSFVYDGKQKQCPWCDKKLSSLFVLRDESETIVFAHELSFIDNGYGDSFVLPEHIFSSFDINTFFRAVMTVRSVNLNGKGIEFVLQQGQIANRDIFININGHEDKIVNRYILQLQEGGEYWLKYKDMSSSVTHSLKITVTESN